MTKTKVSRKPSKKTSRKTSKKRQGGSSKQGRTVKVRALIYKNSSKKPDVIIRVQNGPKPYLMDIFRYHIADSEEFITNVMKGFPKPPYQEQVMTIKYEGPK